jgi:hypothetical protein
MRGRISAGVINVKNETLWGNVPYVCVRSATVWYAASRQGLGVRLLTSLAGITSVYVVKSSGRHCKKLRKAL